MKRLLKRALLAAAPESLSRKFPRTLSDNVLVIDRKLADGPPLAVGWPGD